MVGYVWILLFAVQWSECIPTTILLGGNELGVRLIDSCTCHILDDVISIRSQHPFRLIASAESGSNSGSDVNSLGECYMFDTYKHTEVTAFSDDSIWIYETSSVNVVSDDSDVDIIALNLTTVLNRPRVVVHTSFRMESTINDMSNQLISSVDAVFTLREHDDVDDTINAFIQTYAASQILDSTADASGAGDININDGSNITMAQHIQAYIKEQLVTEVRLRTELVERARKLLSTFHKYCPGGVRIGVGEKKLQVVDVSGEVADKSSICVLTEEYQLLQ